MSNFALTRHSLATGVELDVADEGPRDAPVLMFLHGFPESHRTWRHQIRHFSDRYRCIAPDQRGYCKSSKPQGVENYTFDKLIADVFALADAMEIGEFTVVGHDWGGAIAWGVALTGQVTGRVNRAIIANAPHPYIFQKLLFENDEQRAASQYIRGFRDNANDAMVTEKGLGAIIMKEVNWDRSPGMTDEDRDLMFRDWAEPDAPIAMLNWYRGSTIIVPAIGEDAPRPAILDAPFPKITIPTLVIWAIEDKALPACNLEGLEDVVTDLRVVPVRDCGHFVTWEAPDAVNAAIDDFLAEA